MRTKSKSFFFSIFFIIISSFSVIPIVFAGEISDPIITTDIFTIDLGSFQDTDGDGAGRFKSAKGGKDLISFENKGEYSRDLENNIILYWGIGEFGVEINVWTADVYDDIYPNVNTHHRVEEPWLCYKRFLHCGALHLVQCKAYPAEYYTFNYNEIDYGDVYNHHRYIGNLPTTLQIRPGMKFSGEITLGGTTFTVPKLTGDIIEAKIVDVRGGECGTYEDIYTNEGFDNTSVDFEVVGEDIPTATQDTFDIINEYGIGLQGTSEVYHSRTIQPGIRDLSCEGNIMSDMDDAYDTMTFNLPVDIQPRVEEYKQRIDYKYGEIQLYTCCGRLKTSPLLRENSIDRVVSYHVYNQFVHYELRFKVALFMTCQFDAQISESTLEDPNLYISDMLWDNSIMGDKGVKIIIPIYPNWWDQLWNNLLMIIIIIAVIAISILVIVKIVIPYYSRKIKRGDYHR